MKKTSLHPNMDMLKLFLGRQIRMSKGIVLGRTHEKT